MSDKSKNKKGQIVLFVIVLLTIAIIIVTSVLSRSLTSVKNSAVNTDSTRAFNAAESGIAELLNRPDLVTIAGTGQHDTSSVDPSTFSEVKYQAVFTDAGFFETQDVLAKDSEIQIDFNSTPINLRVHFEPAACVLISAINTVGSLSRTFVCGSGASAFENATSADTAGCATASYNCTPGTINFTGTAYTLLIKVLAAGSRIRVTADNYDDSFKTKNITGTAWATTKSNVKKEIEVITKTTKDIYPVFDYALYLR